MALNKQRILSELGSVVNQLQSAECGCMGKLFSDPGQASPVGCGGCRAGACCHGHGSPYSGEPYSPANNQFTNGPCMGRCNPPKLYADTYSYLNKNLMQPVVNEVYNDLKSICPANTVMNNPMATTMGLSPTNQAGQGNMGALSGGNSNQAGDMRGITPGYNAAMGYANSSQQMGQNNQYMGQMNNPMRQMSQPTDQMGGMGAQIVNMMMSDKSSKPVNVPAQNGQLNDSMLINAPQSPHGQVGLSTLNPGTYGTSASGTMQNTSYGQDNTGAYTQNPTAQYMSQPNAYAGSAINNMPQNNMPQYTTNPHSSGASQNAPPMTTNRSYGQHTQGMKKFGEMFPGVMQGDLGFDPMAIAIQMNPANQQKAALSSMQQLMNGNKIIDPNSSVMKPLVNAANVASSGIAGNQSNQQVMPSQPIQPAQYQQPMQQQLMQQQPMQQQPMQQQPMQQQPMQQQSMQQQPLQQQSMQQQPLQQQPLQQQPTQQLQPVQHQQSVQHQQPVQQLLQQQQTPSTGATTHQVPQQQVYTAGTGSAIQYQQAPANVSYQYQQQPQQYQTQEAQQVIDPNTGAVTNPPNLPGGYTEITNGGLQQVAPQAEDSFGAKQMIMEPIFPADTSKNQSLTYSHHIKHPRNLYYNTLGQPVQMLDAKMYHPPEPTLPQTLSPQPIALKPRTNTPTFSNVKNTVSKTSLMAHGKVGKSPSKTQLQHLYNQYKGSQSFTQQNINAPLQHHTYSEGKLNDPMNASPPRQVPLEKVGGDTMANNVNNVNNQVVNNLEQFAAPMGDVATVNKPQGDGAAVKEAPAPTRMTKGRNGLQDMVYTSGPTSAAWTFHGHNHMPYSTGYRFRSKVR